MNRILSILTLWVLLFAVITCKTSTNSGLVAYYPFDGNANDQSGNGNHGVVNGAALTSDRFGNEKSAYSFDGAGNTILANVKNMPSINTPLSFAWWFYIDTIPVFTSRSGAQNMIVLVNKDEGIGVQVGFRSPGYNTLGFDTWNWGGGTLLQVKLPEAKQWYHCVYSFDGTKHRFYINANEIISTVAKTQNGIPSILMFGNYPTGKQYFEGKLDDIRIYNRAIEMPEIDRLYKKRDK
jgi:hypothetical protein